MQVCSCKLMRRGIIKARGLAVWRIVGYSVLSRIFTSRSVSISIPMSVQFELWILHLLLNLLCLPLYESCRAYAVHRLLHEAVRYQVYCCASHLSPPTPPPLPSDGPFPFLPSTVALYALLDCSVYSYRLLVLLRSPFVPNTCANVGAMENCYRECNCVVL